jgi:hypothetical protein
MMERKRYVYTVVENKMSTSRNSGVAVVNDTSRKHCVARDLVAAARRASLDLNRVESNEPPVTPFCALRLTKASKT